MKVNPIIRFAVERRVTMAMAVLGVLVLGWLSLNRRDGHGNRYQDREFAHKFRDLGWINDFNRSPHRRSVHG